MPEVPVIGARLETYRGRAEAALAMLLSLIHISEPTRPY